MNDNFWGKFYHFWGSIVTLGWPLHTKSNPPRNFCMVRSSNTDSEHSAPPSWQCQDFERFRYIHHSLRAAFPRTKHCLGSRLRSVILSSGSIFTFQIVVTLLLVIILCIQDLQRCCNPRAISDELSRFFCFLWSLVPSSNNFQVADSILDMQEIHSLESITGFF